MPALLVDPFLPSGLICRSNLNGRTIFASRLRLRTASCGYCTYWKALHWSPIIWPSFRKEAALERPCTLVIAASAIIPLNGMDVGAMSSDILHCTYASGQDPKPLSWTASQPALHEHGVQNSPFDAHRRRLRSLPVSRHMVQGYAHT